LNKEGGMGTYKGYDDSPQTVGKKGKHIMWQEALEDLRSAVEGLFSLIDAIEGNSIEDAKDPKDKILYSLSDFLKLEGKPLHELAERVDLVRNRIEELLF